MFHSREVNNRINNLHFRALRMTYLDETSSFEELLKKDGSVTIHHQNLRFLAIEMFKVYRGMAPAILHDVFNLKENSITKNISSNTRFNNAFYSSSNPKNVNSGVETLRFLGPKIWNMVPSAMKSITSLHAFKDKIKKWLPTKCPCRLCKTYVPNLGFCNISYS